MMDGAIWVDSYAMFGSELKPFMLQLVDAGYDVWLGNNRGTEYSQGHVTYDIMVDEKEYWDFSWAEMGLYDDTANIKKMKEVSGEEKVFYIGYS